MIVEISHCLLTCEPVGEDTRMGNHIQRIFGGLNQTQSDSVHTLDSYITSSVDIDTSTHAPANFRARGQLFQLFRNLFTNSDDQHYPNAAAVDAATENKFNNSVPETVHTSSSDSFYSMYNYFEQADQLNRARLPNDSTTNLYEVTDAGCNDCHVDINENNGSACCIDEAIDDDGYVQMKSVSKNNVSAEQRTCIVNAYKNITSQNDNNDSGLQKRDIKRNKLKKGKGKKRYIDDEYKDSRTIAHRSTTPPKSIALTNGTLDAVLPESELHLSSENIKFNQNVRSFSLELLNLPPQHLDLQQIKIFHNPNLRISCNLEILKFQIQQISSNNKKKAAEKNLINQNNKKFKSAHNIYLELRPETLLPLPECFNKITSNCHTEELPLALVTQSSEKLQDSIEDLTTFSSYNNKNNLNIIARCNRRETIDCNAFSTNYKLIIDPVPDTNIKKSTWTNKAFKIFERKVGSAQLQKRLHELSKVPSPGFATKTQLRLLKQQAKNTVGTERSFIRLYNCVGAVGYAVVIGDDQLVDNDFFRPDSRFRVRLRLGNVRCVDDAGVSQRQAAIKFCDQNEDGPLDLIFYTGRVALARSSDNLKKILKLRNSQQSRDHCFRDPHFHFSLIDSMRRAPESYAQLVYHGQVTYLLKTRDDQRRLVRFRLVPEGGEGVEDGLLDDEDQLRPWSSNRASGEMRSATYLREEFLERMEGFHAVRFTLQIQVCNDENDTMWNPQLIWDTEKYPWKDLMRIQLTTVMPMTALCKTYFNIVDKPPCLIFVRPFSVHDYKSYQYMMCGMYTRMELEHMQIREWRQDKMLIDELDRKDRREYCVGVCTAQVKDIKTRVEILITLIGTRGRSPAIKLDNRVSGRERGTLGGRETERDTEYFLIKSLPVGEVLAVNVAVRHRHVTDDWYLKFIILSESQTSRTQYYPCHMIVMSKVTLRPGEVSLPQTLCHELLKHERMLELTDRRSIYAWSIQENNQSLPSRIYGDTLRHLPLYEQVATSKYTGMPWDVDPTTIETLLPFLLEAVSRGLLPNIPLLYRQTKLTNEYLPSMGPVRRLVSVSSNSAKQDEVRARARRRWRKIRYAIAFICKPRIPEGPKGDMCRSVEDDVDFGRLFLVGSNPIVLRRISSLPENLPVYDDMFEGYLNRGLNLNTEIELGHVYIADYKILSDIPCTEKGSDRRFVAAPIVLLFVRESGDLIPLCIQLGQEPGPDNPIWTPKDIPEDWILAKLWVRCADFHYQFAISHLLKTHLVMEPFAVATIRQLSSSHPVYKLLKPHMRYSLTTNTLLCHHVLHENCSLDKYTALGSCGFRTVMEKYMKEYFSFDELYPEKDFSERGVLSSELLPTYYYRDDAISLWECLDRYVGDTLRLFYTSDRDVMEDSEIQEWIREINEVGFRCFTPEERYRKGLLNTIDSVEELVSLVTMIIFTSTCQHSATHTEALDLYGFIPGVPAMMRKPPATRKRINNKDLIAQTLPDQFPDAYYGSLASLLQVYRPDDKTLGDISEIYFVEPEAQEVARRFMIELEYLGGVIRNRNRVTSILYESLLPTWIPNSVEVLPFLPRLAKKEAMRGISSADPSRQNHVFIMTPSVPLNILPMCMFLARHLNITRGDIMSGGVGLSATGAVEKVGIPKIDKKNKNKLIFTDIF